jgi:DNA-binding NarL/FixJ family response regulator
MNEHPARALIVEDESAWQALLREILADVGLEVDVASNYETALATLRSGAHRLAVVDLSLDAADYQNQEGLRVLDALRRSDPACVPVLLTGFATVELAVSVLNEHGAFTCLRKETFRRAQFRDVLRQVLALAPVPARLPAAVLSFPDPPAPAGVEAPPLLGRRSSRTLTVQKEAAPVVLQAPGSGPASAASAASAANAAYAGGATSAAGAASAALVVEDDAGWRSILGELLAEAGYRVRECSSYAEAFGCLRRGRYAVTVVDLSLANSLEPVANRDGCRVLEKAQAAGIPAIVVSGRGTRENVEQAYGDYGVAAFLEKQGFERAGFLAALAEAVTGSAEENALPELTRREREVLVLLAQGLTNKGIANAMVISTNTVKRYLKSIFEKLDVDSRASATARAFSAGLVNDEARRR